MSTIRAANIGDLETVFEILGKVIRMLDENGVLQWDHIYPNKSILREDIENGHMFVISHDGAIVGAITLNEEAYPGYADIKWNHEGTVLLVHRLIIDPLYQRKGFASMLMSFAEKKAERAGYDAIRLDAFVDNPAAIAMYEHRGYRYAGTVQSRKGEFRCYEKPISMGN